MQFFKRIFFFLLTNMAVLALLSIVMSVINIFYPGILASNGGIVQLLIYAAILGFGGSFISLLISRWSAKKAYNIVLIDAGSVSGNIKLQSVWNTVERIAQAKNITMPEVGYYESAEPNAFATGSSKNKSLVAVSTGLLEQMEKNEIEGVIGHEMAHILNGDMVTLTLIQGVMNTFVIVLTHLATRAVVAVLAKDEEDGETIGYFAQLGISMVFQIIFGLLASFVIMWFSRIREYRADIGGAEFTSRSSMVAGLKRLQKMTKIEHTPQNDAKMTAFMINEPDSWLSTHPSLTNRIKALEENYKLV
ncbi:protease HtpX [Candidatus Gracilibacteria bacterium]|nr:protease HtpX [Candidatus Gracilibacteria bacterium]